MPAPRQTLADLTRRQGAPVQTFTFDPTQAQVLHTLGGATIRINDNLLVRPDNSLPVGPVRLQVQEVYTPAQMVLTNLATQARGGGLLESGGMFNIRAYEGSTRLKVRSGWSAVFSVSWPVPPRVSADLQNDMLTWALAGSDPDSLAWIPVADSISGPIAIWPSTDSSTWVRSFTTVLWPDTLGWLNCDAYWQNPTPPVVARIDVGGIMAGTRLFLIPTARNGAFRLYWNASTQQAEQYVPAGLECTAVVLREIDGQLFFGSQRATVQDGFVYRPRLEALSEDEIVRRLREL